MTGIYGTKYYVFCPFADAEGFFDAEFPKKAYLLSVISTER